MTVEYISNTLPDGTTVSHWVSDTPVEEVASDQVCTPAQGLVALYATKGITEADIHSLIDLIEDEGERYTARVAFSRATEWRRSSSTVQVLAQLIPLTETELDALYDFAATVAV